MKHTKAAIACGLALVLLVLVAGCAGNSNQNAPTSQTATVVRGTISKDVSAAGNLAFSQTEDLPFSLFYPQGTVSNVYVAVGDAVTKGETLATVDPAEWQTNLNNLENDVTTAERNVATKQQAVQSANRTVATKQQGVSTAMNTLAADQATVASMQLAVTQAQLDVTTANNTINSLTDIANVLDQIDATNQTIATATMILNGATVGGVSIAVTGRSYFVNLITGSQNFLTQLNTQLKNLLDGTTAMSSTQAQLQLQQDQLTLQTKQLALSSAQTAVAQVEQTIANDQTAIEYARQDVATAQQNVTFAEQDLTSAHDNYNTAEQKLQDAQAMSPVVTAPFAGIITNVNVAGGDKIQNGTIAVSIADPSRFEANILVSELDIPQVTIGDTATVTADAVPNSVFTANVTQISPTATISSGVVNYVVTVELQALVPIALRQGASGNVTSSQPGVTLRSSDSGSTSQNQSQLPTTVVTNNYQLRQGMTVTVDISIAERSNVLLVPNAAITIANGKSYVTLINGNGQTSQQEVQTGLSDWQNTEITSGLTEGEKIVVPLNLAPSSSGSSGPSGQSQHLDSGPIGIGK